VTSYGIISYAFFSLWNISNCRKVLQVSSHFDSSKWCAWDDPTTKISCDPELTELTRNHRTWCMTLRSKYCTKTQCCWIWLTCKTFQRDVSFKIHKGLLHMNDYYICVRRFVVSDPELQSVNNLVFWNVYVFSCNVWLHHIITRHLTRVVLFCHECNRYERRKVISIHREIIRIFQIGVTWSYLCVVIFEWPAGIIDYMLHTFNKRVSLMCSEASMLLHICFSTATSSFNTTRAAIFNTTKAAIFHVQAMLP